MTAIKDEGVDFVSLRRAGQMLRGKAPTTVKSLVLDGDLEMRIVQTEAGHKRRVISVGSIQRLLAKWDAAERPAGRQLAELRPAEPLAA